MVNVPSAASPLVSPTSPAQVRRYAYMSYRLSLFVIAIFVSLWGCSNSKPILNCAGRPDSAKLVPAERVALADALSRYGKRCERKDWQCEISLIRNSRHEIVVTVASVYPHRDSGHCVQAPGEQDLAVYNSDGTFVREVMSL